MKPTITTLENASYFKDEGIVAAYRYRPRYPSETFDFLNGLIGNGPKRVLDVGCGTGDIARPLVNLVDQVDAVDFSSAMIEAGKQLQNGDHPNLRWIHGPIEEVPLKPPYGLVTAGASLHWLDWSVVMPLFSRMMPSGGYLAVLSANATPHTWEMLGDTVSTYREDGGFQPFDLYGELEKQGYFKKVGEHRTEPMTFNQPIDEYVESYHSRPGFSRERMGTEKAAAFAQEAREVLSRKYPNGIVPLEVTGHVIWGVPSEGTS